jgi:C4-type Zn-finger protein
MPTVESNVNITNIEGIAMTRLDEINAKIAALEEERKDAMLTERGNVLTKIKADIKAYGFMATDFKGLLESRVTQKKVDDFLASKAAKAKKAATTKKTAK